MLTVITDNHSIKIMLVAAGLGLLTAAMVFALGPPPPPEGVVREGKTDRADAKPRASYSKHRAMPKDIGPRVVTVERIQPLPAWLPQQPIEPVLPPPAPLPPTRPAPAVKPAAAVKPERRETKDVCAKHGRKKVWINSKKWRCKK
jgi:hypothetical protein